MNKNKKNNKVGEYGFSHVELVIGIVVIILIIGVGFFVYKHNDDNKSLKSVASVSNLKKSATKDSSPKKAITVTSTTTASTKPAATKSSITTITPINISTTPKTNTTFSPVPGTAGGPGNTGGQISEIFSYDPTDNPSSPLSNNCHNNTENVTCPSGGEGLVVSGGSAYLVIPSGWSFNAGEYAYVNSSNQPGYENTSWNGQGSLPLTMQYHSQTVTLAIVVGSLVQN
jgi:uncharacterized protein (UPF0333 family)